MPYFTAKRIADGLLYYVDNSPNLPADTSAVIQNAVNSLGGVAEDWEFIELDESQALSVRSAMPGRSYVDGEGTITSKTPPQATVSAASITADGVDSLTLDVDVQDAEYNGDVNVKIEVAGSVTTATITATAGIASDTITTEELGVHRVEVSTIVHGLAVISFEGV